MNKTVLTLLLFLIISSAIVAQKTESLFQVQHGPYLQEITESGVTILFSTNKPAFSWVEIADKPGNLIKVFSTTNGLKMANNTFNSIRIESLKTGQNYTYSICSKEILKFEPYSVIYGDSIKSKPYTFTTLNPDAKNLTFIEVSDIHGNNEKLQKLLNHTDVSSAEMVVYCGDMIDYIAKPDQPFTGFIDKSVDLFASEKPMIFTRGNHETRGFYARDLPVFFPRKDGRFFYSFRQGPVFFIILDSGEDKEDTHPVYAGLANFDSYRKEQTEWLKKVIKSREFKKAPYKIVVCHIPPAKEPKGHGEKEVTNQWLPILNQAGINLMLSGHQHRFSYNLPGSIGNTFPVLIGSNNSAVRIEVNSKSMALKAYDTNGSLLKSEIIPSK